MNSDELKTSVSIEFENIDKIISEIKNVFDKIGNDTPDIIQITALSAFASQFYTGVENILKRISNYYNIPLPTTNDWHIVLFKRFCNPPYNNLPMLFNDSVVTEMNSIRKFRHYFFHGYSFRIEWDWLKQGLENIENLHSDFKSSVNSYLKELK